MAIRMSDGAYDETINTFEISWIAREQGQVIGNGRRCNHCVKGASTGLLSTLT